MKSIIFEATSVAKAIEQSWIKTGKPQNFSVKVLEQEEKNFLGMTKKPAKIAFFFEEKIDRKVKFETRRPIKRAPSQVKKEKRAPLSSRSTTTIGRSTSRQIGKQDKQEKKVVKPIRQGERVRKSPWTDPMVTASKKWVSDMLTKMDLSHIKFSVNSNSNNIKFHFEKPLMENKNREKELFRNFASLLMQTLRYKFKKQFRNLKAVFTSD
ncbi:Jag N-terminal domain-containing protein [Candidatus Dependentiae bacterium]